SEGATPPSKGLVDAAAFARLTTLLPEKPVHPGDSWTTSAPNPLTGQGDVVATSRFFRVEPVGGIETARIHQSYSLPIRMALQQGKSAAPVTVEGTMAVSAAVNFDPAAGRVVRYGGAG